MLNTFLYYPNQTLCDSVDFSSRPFFQFNASISGTYLLRISAWDGRYSVNYSISSSHSISNAVSMTPYNANGTIAANGAVWHNIHNVNQNELVLISISGSEGLVSNVYYPNLTECASVDYSSSHVYQFNASISGTYLLRISAWDGRYSVNYSISSSHNLDDNVLVTSTPLITVSPTTTPTSTSIPTSSTQSSPTTAPPLNISALSSGSITFEVPASFSNSGAKFTYDFGDGTSTTTNNTKVTHVYENPGNYVFTLKLEGDPDARIIETYAVTVTPPAENPLLKYTWPIVTSIVAGLSVATITALVRRRKKGPP